MSFRKKAAKFKDDLDARHKESAERKDETVFGSIFDMEKLRGFFAPRPVYFWRPEKGDHEFDIIPFFAGTQHPKDPEGRLSYVIDLWVYQRVGVLKDQFISPAKNFRINDPIAEYINITNLTKDQYKAVAAKRRTFYFIWSHDTPEEEAKGIQIWDVAHWFVESNLDEIAKKPREGGYIPFSHHENGKRIALNIKSEGKYIDGDGVERDSVSYKGHRFIDRPSKIPDEILDQSFPLDEAIVMHPEFDAIYEAFHSKKRDGETPVGVKEPAKRLTKTAPPVKEEPTVEEETTADEEQTADAVDDLYSGGEEGSCPDGGTWGSDNEQRAACATCALWDPCSDAALNLTDGAVDPPPPPAEKKTTAPAAQKKKPIVRRKS